MRAGIAYNLVRFPGFAALMLCGAGCLLVRGVAAQEGGTQQTTTCGQTRSVLVRFLDGKPAPVVKVTLASLRSEASPEMGGPELYAAGAAGAAGGPTGPTAQSSPTEGGQAVTVSPLRPPDLGCRPVVTGTLTALTNPQGRVRFDQLGDGAWVVQFEGEVAYSGRSAYIVPVSVQGLFPQGRTRAGGGFIEQVTSLNEEGGPNPEPVSELATPGAGHERSGGTSRYVLEFSAQYEGWLPGLDLVTADNSPPVPLAEVTPPAMATPAISAVSAITSAGATPAVGQERNAESPANGTAQESSFDMASVSVEEASGSDQPALQTAGQKSGAPWFNAWLAVAGLTLGGVGAIVWAKRRSAATDSTSSTELRDTRGTLERRPSRDRGRG